MRAKLARTLRKLANRLYPNPPHPFTREAGWWPVTYVTRDDVYTALVMRGQEDSHASALAYGLSDLQMDAIVDTVADSFISSAYWDTLALAVEIELGAF